MVSAPSTGGANGSSGGTMRSGDGSGGHKSNAYPTYAAHIPLSMRKAPPLDMSTVERRGQPLGTREVSKRTRPHNIPEAPTFKPTEEEFKDPMEYIRKIAPEGAKFGICKIIPPDSWNPPFAIDTEASPLSRFHFRTRRQELNSVEGSKSPATAPEARPNSPSGTRTNLNYLDQLARFHKQQGMNLNRFPSVDKRPLDLYKLKKAVEVRGGFEQVCKLKKWAEIGRDLGYSGKIMSSLSTSLKNSYQKWLSPYEDYLRAAKPGVQQQLDLENGGLSPSPANSPMNRSFQKSTPHSDSPAARASQALNSTLKAADDPENIAQTPEAPRPAPGFTAVNSGGGFTPVNAHASFLPVNGSVKKEPETTLPLHSIGVSSATNTPDRVDSPGNLSNSQLTNGTATHLKRAVSHESMNTGSGTDSTPNVDEKPGSRRSSKRHKRESAPMVAGSHMSMSRPQVPRPLGPKPGMPRPQNTKQGERCESCGQPDDPSNLVICDSCDSGYHRNCMEPPIKVSTDWNCPKCLVGTGDYGFEEGGIYGLKQFQEKANNFKESWFGPRMHFDPVLNRKRPVTEDDVEREFWRLVESLTETVEVEYGADIHSTTHGSGFPHHETSPQDPYSVDQWNLNILPLLSDSLFKHIKSDISGMTVPWLYVGMCFSTFCWHNEDHYTYSANYQHFGATKTWYGIPGADAARFEMAMKEAVPELFEQQPDLLFQLVTLLPPDRLRQAGVNVYALDQRAGQFVITFPQAYHAGFNHGFNFNEAVNFAPADWEPFGRSSISRLQEFRRQPCFSHDELLLTAAARDSTIQTAKWLVPALQRLESYELQLRHDFRHRHLDFESHNCKLSHDPGTQDALCRIGFSKDEKDLPEEEYVCAYCKAYAYLSRFVCQQSGRVMCLLHAGTYDCCGVDPRQRHTSAEHTLRYRFTDDEIKSTVSRVAERARAPDAWKEKLDKYVDNEEKPALKTLKSLVSEGERIPYTVPGLAELKAYVERCNDWVEEATNYITRKQQNRRKNDRVWRKASLKSAEAEEREREHRSIENIYKLLNEADDLSFDDPVILTLQERADDIEKFRMDAEMVLKNQASRPTQEIEDLIEIGKGFNVDVPEVDRLENIARQLRWSDKAAEMRRAGQTLKDVEALISEGRALDMSANSEQLRYWVDQKDKAERWETKAQELIDADSVNHHQLDALSSQAITLPVSQETRDKIDKILAKQREAERQIGSLYEKSKSADYTQRPKYKSVRDVLDSLQEFNSKPNGFMDLEKEVKRHEDWMRHGKKLFGKANAPLHILLSHMTLVRDRNEHCLDLAERPRMPVEPASREATPENDQKSDQDVFCICRLPENGMMIECELCHEWYHGKCLKIARGKYKPDDKFTCPICDYRVPIPRDATRPRLEDLQIWQEHIPNLPFQPEEDSVLDDIVNTGQEFRDHIRPLLNTMMSTPEEVTTQRFYLRKVEGADILLGDETNFFRQELHRWVPVAAEPPPMVEISLSTRKPRPTKQQKMMASLGISNPEDLPVELRTKAHTFKTRKASNSELSKAVPLQPAPLSKGASTAPNSGRAGSRNRSSAGNTPQTPTAPQMFQGPPQTANPIEVGGNPSPTYSGWQSRISGQASPPGVPRSPIFRPTTPGSVDQGDRGPLDPGLFSPSTSALAAAALRDSAAGAPITLASPMRESYAHTHTSSGGASGGNMDNLFADFTGGDEAEKDRNEAGEALEILDRPESSNSAEFRGLKDGQDELDDPMDLP